LQVSVSYFVRDEVVQTGAAAEPPRLVGYQTLSGPQGSGPRAGARPTRIFQYLLRTDIQTCRDPQPAPLLGQLHVAWKSQLQLQASLSAAEIARLHHRARTLPP